MNIEKLGKPDLKIGKLCVWIHGRQFPDASDYWDGNWLNSTAYCGGNGSSVQTSGSIIHLGEIQLLLESCEALYETLAGEAVLPCIEPNLSVTLDAQTGGHVGIAIDITPDHMSETHQFTDVVDQSCLPEIISACRELLTQNPIRDVKNGPP